MRTRRVFKEKFTNKIMQDSTAEELEFPDVEVNDYPEVGDRILLDGKKATGERLMPDGTVIKFKDGVVTHIIEEPENVKNIKKMVPIKDGVCKTFNGWKDSRKQTFEILGNNTKDPFRIGNRIRVNGKVIKAARCEVGDNKVTILNGRISEVKSLNASEGGRVVFKSKEKKA